MEISDKINEIIATLPQDKVDKAKGFRAKIAGHYNPVEFVNNMYGCHPGGDGPDNYFTKIYKRI